jgi:hypothetical protein
MTSMIDGVGVRFRSPQPMRAGVWQWVTGEKPSAARGRQFGWELRTWADSVLPDELSTFEKPEFSSCR